MLSRPAAHFPRKKRIVVFENSLSEMAEKSSNVTVLREPIDVAKFPSPFVHLKGFGSGIAFKEKEASTLTRACLKHLKTIFKNGTGTLVWVNHFPLFVQKFQDFFLVPRIQKPSA